MKVRFKKSWGGRTQGTEEDHDEQTVKYLEFNDIAERVDESQQEQKPNKIYKAIKRK